MSKVRVQTSSSHLELLAAAKIERRVGKVAEPSRCSGNFSTAAGTRLDPVKVPVIGPSREVLTVVKVPAFPAVGRRQSSGGQRPQL